MNIICRKTNCKYNNNFVCYAKGIDISNNSLCNTFEDTSKDSEDTSKNILKKPPKYNQYRPAKNLKIECQAKCQFNREKVCHANGITINSLEECPYCITYFKKVKNK